MAFNPFLSGAAEPLNPFASFGAAEPEPYPPAGDNPFAASNPFAAWGPAEPEPAPGDTVPAEAAGGGAPEPACARLFPARPASLPPPPPTPPEPPARPLPPETHDLILSVTGHMEFASSHLLDRIPPTRTPSPVSARDLHSPSPTPDHDHDLDTEPEPDPEPEPAPAPPPADAFDINRNKPARPPPARPPPARAPPRPAPPAPAPADDINLFAAPPSAAAAAKPSTAHILSLYAAGAPPDHGPRDFLSDDIVQDEPVPMDCSEPAPAPPAPPAPAAPDPAQAQLDGNPFGSVDTSPFEGVHASPLRDIEVSPFEGLEASPFAGSEASPFDGTDTSPFGAVVPHCFEGAETSPFKGTEASPFDGAETSPFKGIEASPFEGTETSFIEASPFVGTEATFIEASLCDAPTSAFKGIEPSPFDGTETSDFGGIEPSPFDGTETSFMEASPFAGTKTSFVEASPFGGTETSPFNDMEASPFVGSETSPFSGFEATPGADPFGVGVGGGGVPQDVVMCEPVSASRPPPPPPPPPPARARAQAQAQAQAQAEAEAEAMCHEPFPESQDAFDAFSAKFESTSAQHMNTGAWGEERSAGAAPAPQAGFEAEAFDPFLSLGPPPTPTPAPAPAATPRLAAQHSHDSADDEGFTLYIRPEGAVPRSGAAPVPVPALAPPPAPRPHALPDEPRANPFDRFDPHRTDRGVAEAQAQAQAGGGDEAGSDGGAVTPPTPLFDEDVSVPLEEFPRTRYAGPGWEMQLRQPNKKKITGQRFWKKVHVCVLSHGEAPVVQLRHAPGDKEPFQELPLQACYSVSEVGAQQFDQFGKIFTVKLQYVFYKERPGVRPGQVTKAERLTSKLSQFAAYAIQGDYQGVKEFGSDLRKLGLPVEHAPQVSQLFKLGSLVYEDVKQFSCCVEEALFRLGAHRDRALTYKMEEVQVTAVDELWVRQDAEGAVLGQIARVRLFFLGFLSGMPDVELGVNDLRRQGKEVVGRHDIIPVVTEEWIRVEAAEFHACVQPDEFANTQLIKFKPPDACYIELMRFRVRPPKNRELPLQLKATWCVMGNKVELRADVLVPGFASRKLGQVPCEDVAIRFPIPECWIYLFRVEKHFRYGSVKSAHRRTGKIKGIERFLGAVDTLQESLIEVTSGQAKYEHPHRAIVWRMPRLPKEGQGAYTSHNMVCRMALTSYDQVPAELAQWAHVEFTMPATQVSHTTVRSVALQQHDGDPPEKCVRYLARHEYIVGIERTSGQAAPAYAVAAAAEPRAPAPAPAPAAPPAAPAHPHPPSSDSDSE